MRSTPPSRPQWPRARRDPGDHAAVAGAVVRWLLALAQPKPKEPADDALTATRAEAQALAGPAADESTRSHPPGVAVIAVYARVSSATQDTRSQDRELQRWVNGQEGEVRWYRDTASGTRMARPGMDRLLADLRAGAVTQVVVWRLDRLGRTAKGLLQLFEEELAPARWGSCRCGTRSTCPRRAGG